MLLALLLMLLLVLLPLALLNKGEPGGIADADNTDALRQLWASEIQR